MRTEHLQNVTIPRVVTGWLVAVAVTSLVVLALVGLGPLASVATEPSTFWSVVAVVIGFWAGGFFTGFRALQAPILHGVVIGLTSLVAWFLVNLLASLVKAGTAWEGVTPPLAVGLLLAQMAAAVVGALMGYNLALRGEPGLRED